MKYAAILISIFTVTASANPYPDASKVPKDSAYPSFAAVTHLSRPTNIPGSPIASLDALRLTLTWDAQTDTYALQSMAREPSGTESLLTRSQKDDALGSYHGSLKDLTTGKVLAQDSVGTGAEYRKLVRAVSFRFPFPQQSVQFELTAENPKSGIMETVFHSNIDPAQVPLAQTTPGFEVRTLKQARSALMLNGKAAGKVLVTFYAEGYQEARRAQFWLDAQKAADALIGEKFPSVESMEFRAAFAPSNTVLGSPQNLGMPIPERDSFLGLYYPYWEGFGRWFNVVYPTREEKFRAAIGQTAYDYPVVLIDDGNYWGIGNYRVFTAVPARSSMFTYLFLHEFGHFFGLNEEYEGGGRTELEFAPNIIEPWSQNMTFLASNELYNLKGKEFVAPGTPLPTPNSYWSESSPTFGAYLGGYGDSDQVHSHKPGLHCVMDRYPHFCPICQHAIKQVIAHDTLKAKRNAHSPLASVR